MVSAFTLGFIFGLLAGWVTACLILVAVMFFRRIIEQNMTILEKQIGLAGPRPKGFIVEPESEAEEFRANIIEKNRQAGKDTPLKDLR